jgi:hypothetical protein
VAEEEEEEEEEEEVFEISYGRTTGNLDQRNIGRVGYLYAIMHCTAHEEKRETGSCFYNGFYSIGSV